MNDQDLTPALGTAVNTAAAANLGVILKRPARFKEPTPEESRHFLITAKGEGEDEDEWHIARPEFIPCAFGTVTAMSVCGVEVEAIGSANYSSQPCSACLEKCASAIRCFYPKSR